MTINSLGDKISNKIQSIQDELDRYVVENNELKATMFKVATQLRLADADKFYFEITQLETPATGCDGNSCLTSIILKDRIAQLEQQIYEHETVAFTLASQLGVNPFDEDSNSSPCCPN